MKKRVEKWITHMHEESPGVGVVDILIILTVGMSSRVYQLCQNLAF